MAEQQQHGGMLDLDQLCCSVCLDLLKDPVTINCGHFYCRSCMEGCWDQEEEKGVFSCPQCRESFSPKPVLGRNNVLAESFQSLSSPSGSPDLPSIVVQPLRDFRDVSDSVSDLRDELEKILKDTWPRISTTVSRVDVLLPPEPKTREDFLQYCCPLTFDVNSVYTRLSLSENNRKVTRVPKKISYPDHPDRFTFYPQVLCRDGLSGCCYWEFEWKGYNLEAAVSYKDIRRTGGNSGFGDNDKSWCLECYQDRYSFRHNDVATDVSGPCSSRVGVYLDHEAGTQFFYNISDTMTLLHKVCTTFTQSLYPGVYLYGAGVFAELIKLW